MTQPNLIYFETLDKNAHFLTDKITISAAEIRKFATQFDPQPYHTLCEWVARVRYYDEIIE